LSFSFARKRMRSSVGFTAARQGPSAAGDPLGQHRDVVLVNPSPCLHLPRGGLRGAVLSSSTSLPL